MDSEQPDTCLPPNITEKGGDGPLLRNERTRVLADMHAGVRPRVDTDLDTRRWTDISEITRGAHAETGLNTDVL